MLRKGPCDFISWQLRFRNLFGEKGGRPYANETKPPHRKGLATACENNEAQPVTIGYRLGFGSVSGPKLSNCSRYRARCAPAYPGYHAALNLQPGRNTMRRLCMRAQLGGIKRESHLHARHATPSSRPAHAVSLRVGRRLGLHTQLQGAQVACQLVLLARRDHGRHSRANGLLAAETGFREQLAH